MDQFWFVATLWVLVGLVAAVLAIWVGGSLRDEVLRTSQAMRKRQRGLRVIRGGKQKVQRRQRLRAESRGLFAVGGAARFID
ncbi:MAG TPA: hypothetical protein VKT49_02095 [Bryobacteraceae bacterium]|nr:hypothetical protein [Bryobacteraceae bacterium]